MFRSDLYNPSSDIAEELRAHYLRLHHAPFPGFVSKEFFPELKADVDRLLEHSRRRDFLMECMDNSPRRMNVVNGHTIERMSTIIPKIYNDPRILDFLSHVVGQRVLPLTNDIDRYVINQLKHSSDTFGAHYDDYPLSFVLIMESPGFEGGGYAEMVPNGELSDLDVNPIKLPLKATDAYILKTDTTAHRVAPLKLDELRTAINLAYTTPGFVPRWTESANLLYAEEA